MKKYHYEYAAYTNNLNYGRMLIGIYATYNEAYRAACYANKGAFDIRKIRVNNTND